VDAVQILELNKHPTTDSSSTPNYKFFKKSNCLIDSTEQQKPAQGKVKVGSFDAIQEQSECPRKWIESEFLRRNLSRGTHRTLSKELKFLKENAQIPPAEKPRSPRKEKTQRRILPSDLQGSEAFMYIRARGGGEGGEGARNPVEGGGWRGCGGREEKEKEARKETKTLTGRERRCLPVRSLRSSFYFVFFSHFRIKFGTDILRYSRRISLDFFIYSTGNISAVQVAV
jgi:hypothetical protein